MAIGYTQVSANAVLGVNALNTSSTISGGETTGTFWIYWTSTGFTGKGWCWGSSYNPIPNLWSSSPLSSTYGAGETGFQAYLNSDNAPSDLNDFLGSWDPISKGAFVNEQKGYLGVYGGIYGSNEGAECMEYHG